MITHSDSYNWDIRILLTLLGFAHCQAALHVANGAPPRRTWLSVYFSFDLLTFVHAVRNSLDTPPVSRGRILSSRSRTGPSAVSSMVNIY